MAVIVAVFSIALVFYIGLLPNEFATDEVLNKVSFAEPEVSHRAVDGRNLTDITVGITKVVPKDDTIKWVEIRLTIKSSNGTTIVDSNRLKSDDPINYSTGSQAQVEVWYIDSPTGTHWMEPGDSIKITGITIFQEGGRVDLLINGEKSGSFVIPIS